MIAPYLVRPWLRAAELAEHRQLRFFFDGPRLVAYTGDLELGFVRAMELASLLGILRQAVAECPDAQIESDIRTVEFTIHQLHNARRAREVRA